MYLPKRSWLKGSAFVSFDTPIYSLHDRTYAITGKNKWIPIILYPLIVSHSAISVYMLVWLQIHKCQLLPPCPMYPFDSRD